MTNFEKREAGGQTGDSEPKVEKLEGGLKRYTLRVIRPHEDRVQTSAEKKAIIKDQVEQGIENPNYKLDRVGYEKLFPVAGSPESIKMGKPTLEISIVRHLKADGNVITDKTKEAFKPEAEKLIDELNITPDTKVIVITSGSGDTIGGEGSSESVRQSRTEATSEVIEAVLNERGIEFSKNDIDNEGDEIGSATLNVRAGLKEFEVLDQKAYDTATKKFIGNIISRKKGEGDVNPAPFDKHPTVFASNAETLQELREATGIEEMSNATVRRGLSALDAIKFHFLENDDTKTNDRVIVISVAHGQFLTDISEGFNAVTNGKFPIVFIGNGASWNVKMSKNEKGDVVEEYEIVGK